MARLPQSIGPADIVSDYAGQCDPLFNFWLNQLQQSYPLSGCSSDVAGDGSIDASVVSPGSCSIIALPPVLASLSANHRGISGNEHNRRYVEDTIARFTQQGWRVTRLNLSRLLERFLFSDAAARVVAIPLAFPPFWDLEGRSFDLRSALFAQGWKYRDGGDNILVMRTPNGA